MLTYRLERRNPAGWEPVLTLDREEPVVCRTYASAVTRATEVCGRARLRLRIVCGDGPDRREWRCCYSDSAAGMRRWVEVVP